MSIIKISSLFAAALIIVACHSTKKTQETAVTPVTPTTPATPVAEAAPVSEAVKSKNGVFAPGEEQVNAVQMKHPGATLPVLTSGYSLYTGTCTNCHGAKSIYRISEDRWPGIIDDMAQKSNLTATEKDALTKYVFAIKATQPVPAK
jgi:cytochrome c5